MDLREQEISREYIYNGKILNLRKDTVALSDGTTAKREIVEHSGGVGVLAVTDLGEVLLVKQYRRPYDEVIYEIPAGKLEKGENPELAGMRELSEETGYSAEKLLSLGAIYPSPGYCGEIIYIFMAKGITEGVAHPDSGEFIKAEKIPLSEVVNMIDNGAIKDSKTIIAVLKYLKKQGEAI